MRKKFFIKLFILAIVCLFHPYKSMALTVFEDNFGGQAIDTSKWSQPPGYYCGNRCSISVSEDMLTLNLNWTGNSYYYISQFPYLQTTYNPFPSGEDWVLTFQMRYLDFNNKGDGFTLFGDAWGAPPIARIWQDSSSGAGLYLWEGNSPLKIWGIPDMMDEWTTFSIEHTVGQYNAYVNGSLAGTAYNTVNAGTIELGSSQPNTDYGVWNPVQFDYIRIDTMHDPPNAASVPEPATLLLLFSGLIAGKFFLFRLNN